MSIFSAAEPTFLADVRLARLATIGPDGAPHGRPVGFSVDGATGTVLPDLVAEGAAEGAAPGVIQIRLRRILVFGIEKGAVPARTVAA